MAWAMSVAGLVVLIIFALCMMARCRLSMFTRKRKRKLGKKKSVKETKDDKNDKATKSDKTGDKKEVKKVMAISATSKQQEQEQAKAILKKKSKKDFILDMIDSVLDPASGVEADTENMKCSLESIDQAGEEQTLRRASDVSLALSLVFDREKDRPVFVKHKQGGKGNM